MRKEMWFKELIILLAVGVFSTVHADAYLEELQPNQTVHGFSVVNLYENSSDRAMGVRFISDRYGFIIDLLQIESVPQAFYWVKTPPTSSKGEPHACEHLLLGKGNRGRYVAALEDMTLANSTAFTAQTRTCYHFNTTAGEGTFYQIFEAKLQALLHPDFTDEEIRREVCHIGIDIDPKDSTLSIDEKGTVYTEMVSAFEKPWYYFYSPMNKMVYGENHPLSYTSGGDPAVMRTMVPKDIWQFHEEMYHLANMGAIIAIPSGINIDSFLMEISGILDRCQAFPDSSDNVGIGSFQFPPPAMAPIGTTRLVNYPSEKTGDPGYVMYSWPADLKMDYTELFMLELFLDAFAGGQTSNLYDLFINSQTRKIDLGGNYVFGSVDSDLGNSIYFGLTGIDNTYVNKTMVDSIGRMIVDETRLVHDFIDGSNELNEFNKRVASILQRNKKQIDN
ncbi:MAG: hypothetical protein U9R56_03300 [candidate division Zixibacteria bacterium]|nr:hypothetical protein [candidate division Zixibacteria bacterium]